MIKFDTSFIIKQLDSQILLKSTTLNKEGASKARLLIIQIGDNLDSNRYVSLKKSYCEDRHLNIEVLKLDASMNETALKAMVLEALGDTNVTGAIIQLPLPSVSQNFLLDLIPKDKDIDLISSSSLNEYYSGDFSRLSPVVRSACLFLAQGLIPNFKFTNLSTLINQVSQKIKNSKVIILGEGFLVGKPLAFFYKTLGANVKTITDYKRGYKLDADFIILATDTPNLVLGEDIIVNANVIDFGSSIIDGKTIGNLNKESPLEHLGIVSFSPGGMGPLVIRSLVCNFLRI